MKKNIGCFHLDNGFPNTYYAFTGGELSVTVERNGGINTLGCLDILKKNGKLYPDRNMTPAIFQKEGNSCGKRCLYGPAVKFISTSVTDTGHLNRNFFHVPDNVKLYPFGLQSSSCRFEYLTTYDMIISGKKILFSFSNDSPKRKDFVIAIDKNHIPQGQMQSLKDQLGKWNNMCGNTPLDDDCRFIQEWDFIGFDPTVNGFVMECVMHFKSVEKKVTILISAETPITCCESGDNYFLSIPWENLQRINLCLVVAESRTEASIIAQKTLNKFHHIVSDTINECITYSETSPTLRLDSFPEVELFSKTAPSFLKAMVFADTGQDACIRAAAHKFGFCNVWDQVWPARFFVMNGDWDTAKKLIRYPSNMLTGHEIIYEHLYTTLFIIAIAEDIVAVSGDTSFLKEIFVDLKRLFLCYTKRANDNGLLAGSGTCGIDDPTEIGINGNVWASCLNGLWYNASRAMENMAFILNDEAVALTAGRMAEKIKSSYLATFYTEKNSYLYSSVKPDTREGIAVFQNVSTLAMDFAYGENLIYPQIKEIAEFQAFQLYHPAGRSAVPYWDKADEMWKNCIMWQHISHEMKTARCALAGEEIVRMMKVYLAHFNKNKTMMETHNLGGVDGDTAQKANWQAFATRALYSGIFESLLGIQCDLGGLVYVPCNITGDASIKDFRFRNGVWNITIDGEGDFAEDLVIDGSPVPGTMKVPVEYLMDNHSHSLKITRSYTRFERPVILSAPGAAICDLESDDFQFSFSTTERVHTTLKVYCPYHPIVKLDGQEIAFDWCKNDRLAWIDMIMAPGSKFNIACRNNN